jgi:hypothetical protein
MPKTGDTPLPAVLTGFGLAALLAGGIFRFLSGQRKDPSHRQ